MIENIRQELSEVSNKDKIEVLSGFFKTGKGEYGEGDVFIGVNVPDTRKIARRFIDADFITVQNLMKSSVHEERLCALLILVEKFKKSDETFKTGIFNFYMDNTVYINNWDLVDLSSPYIVGAYLLHKDKSLLYKLAESENMWERRISIVSTLFFVRNGILDDSINLAQKLINDNQDLIRKATGWVLREVGKKDKAKLITFLDRNYKSMPRTTLRYAIEKFEKWEREYYMK